MHVDNPQPKLIAVLAHHIQPYVNNREAQQQAASGNMATVRAWLLACSNHKSRLIFQQAVHHVPNFPRLNIQRQRSGTSKIFLPNSSNLLIAPVSTW
jgi:hypothetical protein